MVPKGGLVQPNYNCLKVVFPNPRGQIKWWRWRCFSFSFVLQGPYIFKQTNCYNDSLGQVKYAWVTPFLFGRKRKEKLKLKKKPFFSRTLN